jgi:Cu/Ag efflux pump CusA
VILLSFPLRSALIILIQLPISVAIGFILLQAFGFHLILCRLPELFSCCSWWWNSYGRKRL